MTVTESLPVVDAVRRELEIDTCPTHEGVPRVQVVLTLTTTISCAPAQLWPLLTSSEALAEWFGPVQGELTVGGRFEIAGRGAGAVIEVVEPHRILVDWEQPEASGPLLLRLDPEDDGTTRLRLRHTVLVDGEDFTARGPGSLAIGWELALLALAARTDGWKDSCLSPVPAPTPQWQLGPEGEEYLRAWSLRWTAEAVAAGMDEGSARRAEDAAVEELLAP